MANHDENVDSGSPSLSEEENNVSDKTPIDRPNLVVDLNIPLQKDGNEPDGVVNYGFEFGENRRNDCAANFNDSKSLAKDKYINDSTDHRYSATLLGKVLNTSCDTEITIPDDPNMNCNKSKTRTGNANSHKNKESHVPEKIPLEEVHSTVVPIISDNYEKALEAQREYSATQNGGKDISHDVSEDKLNQQNNGKRFEEYFMPANTHKKFLRGEKLYLTKEKEVATCSGWKLVLVCGSLLLIIVGVLLGVLAGVGVLVKESSIVMKGSSLPDSASMSAEVKDSNELSSLPITVDPSLQTVPKVLIMELTFANESFSDELLSNSSKEYISLVLQIRKMLASSFKNSEMNITSLEIFNSRPDSIIARFIVNLQESEISENNATEIFEKYARQKNNMISGYHVKKFSVWIAENFNTCLVNKGNCSYECYWNQQNYSQTCLCPSNFVLSDDLKTCLKKHLGNGKINGVGSDKTTPTPKMMTEVPTTHSSLLLVTDVVTTMPNLGISTWTSVPQQTSSDDSSTFQSSESLPTSFYKDIFNTELSITTYSSDPYETEAYETTINKNKVLELTTGGRVDDTTDMSTLTLKTKENQEWDENTVTTTYQDWSVIVNLNESAKTTNIYNNTSDTLAMVTNNYFTHSSLTSTSGTDISNITDNKMLVALDNATDSDFSINILGIIENSTDVGSNETEVVTYGNDTLNNTVSTVVFNSSSDVNTVGYSKILDAVTTTMEKEIFNETATKTLSTDSYESFTKSSDNASSVTEGEYITISALADSNVTSVVDAYNQTTLTPLSLIVTNSANLNNTSPIYVTSTESTATGFEAFSAQNVTKEQTLVEPSLNTKNSSETIFPTMESIDEILTTQSQILSTGKPIIDSDNNENVTNYNNVSSDVTHFITVNVSKEYINQTVDNDLLDVDFKQNPANSTSTIVVSTNFDTALLNASLPSEEAITKRITRVDNSSYFITTTNLPVTSTEKETIYHAYDETTIDNDYNTASDFVTDIQTSDATSYNNNNTEDSRNLFSTVTDTTTISEIFITEILHETENDNIGKEGPNITSEHPIQDNNVAISTKATEINEITNCDNCSSDITSTAEQTTVLPIASTNNNEYTFDVNNVTLTSVVFNSSDMIPSNIPVELVYSNNPQFMDLTTTTELINKNVSNVENDNNTDSINSSVDNTSNSTSIETDSNADSNDSSVHSTSNSIFVEDSDNTNSSDSSVESTSNNTSVESDSNIDNNDSSIDSRSYSISVENNVDSNGSSVDSISNSTSVETENISTLGNVPSASYGDSNVTEFELNFTDISINQLNKTSIMTLLPGNAENTVTLFDTNFSVPNENRSLKEGNISSDILNQTEMTILDSFVSNTDYETRTVAMNVTSASVVSGKIAMNETLHYNCSEGKFPCSDGSACLDLIKQCDGIKDCPDASDENQCKEDCRLNFRCINTSLCVSATARCDNIWDCEDGSDEDGCEPPSCDDKEVMCSDGSACIKPADICNEAYNCHDKSDEVGCVERTTCDTNRFFCPEGLCIPLTQMCDAVQDCRNGEDEANCSCTGNDVFQCLNSICLTKDVFCDGKIDCQDGSDERGCVQVDVNGIVQAYDHHNQTWKLLCAEKWSENDGNYICQELGFSSAVEIGAIPVASEAGWMERNNYITDNSTLWTLGVQPVDLCDNDMAATVKCEEYACGGSQNQYRRKRIAGGQESGHLPGQWTSLAVLYSTETNKTCHGEVISPVWILTSSQCLISHLMDFPDLSVRAGIISSNEVMNSTQERKAQEIIIHPHSSIHRFPALRDYDVALIKIDEPFELNRYVNAICLGEEEIQEGITCFTGSFQNQKSKEESHTTSSLSHLAVSVTDRNSCNSTEHYFKSITSRMICGQTTGSTSLCNNDDGVPLMCLSTQRKYHVAGMLSYQHKCSIYYKQPAVFSNINDMRPFIETVVGKNRYNISYDNSLYVIVEMTENTTSVNNTTVDFIVTTLQAEVFENTDTKFDMDPTAGIALAKLNNFTYETTTTSLSEEDFTETTATVMMDIYLSNETNSNQNTTADVLENSGNETLLQKLVSDAKEIEQHKVTPAKTDGSETINSSSLVTTVALKEFEILTEVHSTIPSIQVINDTEFYNITKEQKALDYESASVEKAVLTSINSTDLGQSYEEDPSIPLTYDNNTGHNNMNISSIFETSLIENTTWYVSTQITSDSVTVKSTTEILSTDIMETYVDNPVTETTNVEHTVSQLHESILSAYFSQPNISLEENVTEDSLKNEYSLNATDNISSPAITKNSFRFTTTEVTKENLQNTYESTTIYMNESKLDIFENSGEINKTAMLINYNNNSFAENTKDLDTPLPSYNYSTYMNISSQQHSILSSQFLTYPLAVSDVPNINSTESETVEMKTNSDNVQDMLINATATSTILIDEESLFTVQKQKINVSNGDFDNDAMYLANVQEYNKTYELNKTITFESSVAKSYSTHFDPVCGIKDLEKANVTWPYMGILKGNVTCLASIISSTWVVTSNYCLLSGASSYTTMWTFLRGYFHSTIKNIVIHPQFETLGIDIALVELDDNSLDSNSSLCLPKYNKASQYHCETVVRTENMEGISTITYVPLATEPVMNCDISYNQLPVQHICINNVNQTCQESGIPMVCINDDGQWQLQGISSLNTCEDNSTSVFINLESLVPWIKDTITSEINH